MAVLQFQSRRPGGQFRNAGAQFSELDIPENLEVHCNLITGVWVLRIVVDGVPSEDELQLIIYPDKILNFTI